MWCPKCKQEKELVCFSKNRNRANGYNGWCKDCVKAKVIELVDNRVNLPCLITELECITCHKVLPIEDNFYKHRRYHNGVYNICNACQKITSKTPEKVKKSNNKSFKNATLPRTNENIEKVFFLLGNKCKDCGREATIENFMAFDLHHIDPKKKKFQLNVKKLRLIWKDEVEQEVLKCELLCACCHRLKNINKNKKNNNTFITNVKKLFIIKGNICIECNKEATLETLCMFDLHHVDSKTKLFNIGQAHSFKCIWTDRLEQEINKCELLCTCCHRLKHRKIWDEKRLKNELNNTARDNN